MAKKVSVEELKRILDDMIRTAEVGFQSSEWYKPLIDLGVLEEEYPDIITDSYYDYEAVAFARRLLDFIKEEESLERHESTRRYGQPRTEEERLKRHYERYGTTELPPRGTGLRKSSSSQIPTCPICGKPMKRIIGNLYQCPEHPTQTTLLPE